MTQSVPPQIPNYRIYRMSLWMMIFSLGMVLLSLMIASLAFRGFLGGGRSWMGIVQSFAVCFGAASVIYIPAFLQLVMARHVRAYGPKTGIGFASIVLSLPFWSYSGAALFADYPYKLWLILALIYGLYMLIWGIANIVKQ